MCNIYRHDGAVPDKLAIQDERLAVALLLKRGILKIYHHKLTVGLIFNALPFNIPSVVHLSGIPKIGPFLNPFVINDY